MSMMKKFNNLFVGEEDFEEEVVEKQARVMTKAFNDIWEVKERFTIPMRKAAYVNSIEKIVKNMRLKGRLS